jgi:hypothetical protein
MVRDATSDSARGRRESFAVRRVGNLTVRVSALTSPISSNATRTEGWT